MLESNTNEDQWQRFFSENPYVLSMPLPVRLAPQDIVPLGRPGLAEPDFVFYAKGHGPLPTYGMIELKKPESKIITITRSNVAILSRDAETAIQQATDYSSNHRDWLLQAKEDSILVLGSQADLFVIMGMNAELSRKLGLELYREMIEKRLPPHLKIIPYDTLLAGFEAQVPRQMRVLIPSDTNESGDGSKELRPDNFEFANKLKTAIQSLPPGYRVVFVLRDIDGLSPAETAESLGLSRRTVTTRLAKARSS